MRKATKTQESWISGNWLSSQLKVNRGAIRYYAVKLKLRYFKFNGARYLEKNNAICLTKRIAYQYQLPDQLVNEVLEAIENTISS